MNDDFDAFGSWLKVQLDEGLGSQQPRIRLRSAPSARRLTLKAAAVAIAAVLVTSGVALAAGTAATGTPNPAVWGQQVKAHVDACRQQLATGRHGIGDCVSSFAKQHGRAQKAAHSHGAGVHGAGAAGHGHGHGAGLKGTPEPGESPDPGESPGS